MSEEVVQNASIGDRLTFEFLAQGMTIAPFLLLLFEKVEGGGIRIPFQHLTFVVFLHSPVVGDEGVGSAVDEVGGNNKFPMSPHQFSHFPQL